MTSILDRFRSRKAEAHSRGDVPHFTHVGRNWHVRRAAYVVTTAERAPCKCPEFCERDHGNE